MRLPSVLRRWAPGSVRARLSLTYAGLFLLAGVVLLAVTYGLVAARLPHDKAVSKGAGARMKLLAECKAEYHPPKGQASVSAAQAAQCERVFAAGAQAAAFDARSSELRGLLEYSLLALALATGLSGGVGWWMAGRALRPVGTITAAARRASERNLGERLRLPGPRDEVRQLADTFDEMLDRLDGAFSALGRFVADASHELRTPLTAMQTTIDVTLAKEEPTREQLDLMAGRLRLGIARCEHLLDGLLTLARSDRGPVTTVPVTLALACEDVLDEADAAIAAMGLTVRRDLHAVTFDGDAVLIGRLVANLVDNAVTHNRTGGWMEVSSGSCDGDAVLRVRSSGDEVPDNQVSDLLLPFRRVERRTHVRPGAGLGLAIVASVARVHGGGVSVAAVTGGGLDVVVRLPDGVAPDPSVGATPVLQG